MKKKKKRTSGIKISRYPFIIHVDPLKESTVYPSNVRVSNFNNSKIRRNF